MMTRRRRSVLSEPEASGTAEIDNSVFLSNPTEGGPEVANDTAEIDNSVFLTNQTEVDVPEASYSSDDSVFMPYSKIDPENAADYFRVRDFRSYDHYVENPKRDVRMSTRSSSLGQLESVAIVQPQVSVKAKAEVINLHPAKQVNEEGFEAMDGVEKPKRNTSRRGRTQSFPRTRPAEGGVKMMMPRRKSLQEVQTGANVMMPPILGVITEDKPLPMGAEKKLKHGSENSPRRGVRRSHPQTQVELRATPMVTRRRQSLQDGQAEATIMKPSTMGTLPEDLSRKRRIREAVIHNIPLKMSPAEAGLPKPMNVVPPPEHVPAVGPTMDTAGKEPELMMTRGRQTLQAGPTPAKKGRLVLLSTAGLDIVEMPLSGVGFARKIGEEGSNTAAGAVGTSNMRGSAIRGRGRGRGQRGAGGRGVVPRARKVLPEFTARERVEAIYHHVRAVMHIVQEIQRAGARLVGSVDNLVKNQTQYFRQQAVAGLGSVSAQGDGAGSAPGEAVQPEESGIPELIDSEEVVLDSSGLAIDEMTWYQQQVEEMDLGSCASAATQTGGTTAADTGSETGEMDESTDEEDASPPYEPITDTTSSDSSDVDMDDNMDFDALYSQLLSSLGEAGSQVSNLNECNID